MTELKCPFCGEKLQQTYSFNPTQFWCSNYYDPKHPINLQGTEELWQALIDTKKKLDIAVDAIKNATEYLGNQEPLVDVMAMNLHIDLSKALEQIKEQ